MRHVVHNVRAHGVHIRATTDSDRSSDQRLQLRKHARKVRDLRHCGDFSSTRLSMKPIFDIANTTALRPSGHGLAACVLSHRCVAREVRGNKNFIID